MRGRLLLVSILLFLQQVSVGQTLINPSAFYQQALTDSSLKHEVMLKGVFWEESTAITNSFFNHLIWCLPHGNQAVYFHPFKQP